MHSVRGQIGGSGGVLFFRRRNIGGSKGGYQEVTRFVGYLE
ncbi:hypothetical protein AKJ09_04510 [Labilithrix luteola]|uniref:Uncharacterized protein n=1 Tax=Labilithrix luteola TaxID=1391654 RepID=A0A0K1PWU5_9BACT|nr:hypothetical protein AKJ09_04510 [Labilithrix luteola]